MLVSNGIASIPIHFWFRSPSVPIGRGVVRGSGGNAREIKNLLILLSPRGAFLLRFSRALVVEKGRVPTTAADAAGWTGAVGLCIKRSLLSRLMAGRAGVWERGILKTFAREARTGERGRIVRGECWIV
jgi:hypothetical protein